MPEIRKLRFKAGDRIRRKDWKKGRFATVVGDDSGQLRLLARYSRKGRYFYAVAQNYELMV